MSVTEKDMCTPFKCVEFTTHKAIFHVNDADMSQFSNQDKKLAKKIADIKLKYEIENKLGSTKAYENLEEQCQISISTMKNTIASKVPPTRKFLYKLSVGLKMDIESANALFGLCGGPLTEECQSDKICMYALRDGDDIYHFIEQFEEYTRSKIALRDRNSGESK